VTLELRNLHKHFTGVPALDGVSLTMRRGEFLALLGPSGSGKTTLLRSIAGLEFLDSGEILIGGRNMEMVPAQARGIGFVFQTYALFRHMTVAENIAFGLAVRPRAQRPNRAEIHRRVREMLDLMGIGDLTKRFPAQISGGQRQRVALARALAIEPHLLLLDEPFGALDAQVRKELRVWLRGLHNRLGLTSIFVTHDQAEALEMADRVAVLRAGRIEQIDVPATLYADPANAFVHEFLGEAQHFACVVADGTAVFDESGLSPLPTSLPGGPAIAVIRPHELALCPGPGPAVVESVHQTGPLSRIAVRLHGRVIGVLQPVADPVPSVGSQCCLDLGSARLYAT
jgi:sulfate transport system ATP-binding protein